MLAHAGIGDDGALELAHFLANNQHILKLDLSGCRLTSVAAMHLGEALRQNQTLQSLVLRHNDLAAGEEAGLQELCEAIRDSKSLRHLDLRHNGISAAFAPKLGEMLQKNGSLTHVELSWNPLDPAGGLVLLERVRGNSNLMDLQVNGCRLAEETVTAIGEQLQCNRMAAGCKGPALPFKGSWELETDEAELSPSRPSGSPRGRRPQSAVVSASMLMPPVPSDALALLPGSPRRLQSPAQRSAPSSNMVATAERTAEMMALLMAWRQNQLERSQTGSERLISHSVQECLEYLDRYQREIEEHKKERQHVLDRTARMIEGFQEREKRYRSAIHEIQDTLLEMSREEKVLRDIASRLAVNLRLTKEGLWEAQEDLKRHQNHREGEEARSKNQLATLILDRRELTHRLRALQERGELLERETSELRFRAQKLREGMVLATG